jgi:hypothetical protein
MVNRSCTQTTGGVVSKNPPLNVANLTILRAIQRVERQVRNIDQRLPERADSIAEPSFKDLALQGSVG